MLKPKALRPGGRVAIVAPASPFTREEFDEGIAEVKRLGFDPVFEESVFARQGGYLSGDGRLRARAFLAAWANPTVDAIIAARGGYGSVQLLPQFDSWRPQDEPKLFIGYSDNTSLLSWLTCQCGITALHGPMLEGRLARGVDGYDERSFMAMVQGEAAGLALQPDTLTTVTGGEASGPLFGGTLTQLVASLGTPYAFDPPAGCILFIEDVNERPYRLDRMMTQLRLSGVLGRANGIVFGEMRACDEPAGNPTARDVVGTFAREFAGPVFFGFPSGHTSGPSWTLPLGVKVRMIATPRPSLMVEESPVIR